MDDDGDGWNDTVEIIVEQNHSMLQHPSMPMITASAMLTMSLKRGETDDTRGFKSGLNQYLS